MPSVSCYFIYLRLFVIIHYGVSPRRPHCHLPRLSARPRPARLPRQRRAIAGRARCCLRRLRLLIQLGGNDVELLSQCFRSFL